MARKFAQIIGIVLAALGVIGIASGEGQLWGLFNIDLSMDIIRLAFAGALLYAGFGTRDAGTTGNVVMAVGVLYIGMALLGIVSPQMFGLIPNGLTGVDIAYHVIVGALGVVAARANARGSNHITA